MKSSLTFQILLHLGSYYFGAFVLTEVLLLLYKFIGKFSGSISVYSNIYHHTFFYSPSIS